MSVVGLLSPPSTPEEGVRPLDLASSSWISPSTSDVERLRPALHSSAPLDVSSDIPLRVTSIRKQEMADAARGNASLPSESITAKEPQASPSAPRIPGSPTAIREQPPRAGPRATLHPSQLRTARPIDSQLGKTVDPVLAMARESGGHRGGRRLECLPRNQRLGESTAAEGLRESP